jgi:GT2 family glycosyltransferase
MVYARTVASLFSELNNPDFDFAVQMEMACDIVSSRNRLAQSALDKGCTHILFVDYDMAFERGIIKQLLDEDKDIIGADYKFRTKDQSTSIPLEGEDITKVFKCKAIGGGFLLIKTPVLEKIPTPWFMNSYSQQGVMISGEDTFFAQAAIKAGFDVYAHPLTSIKHIAEQLV